MSRPVIAVAAGALALISVGSVQAAGINLYWNDCSVSGVTNRNFACTNNTATFDLYVSIDPPTGVVGADGHEIVIDLQSASNPMPAWWDFHNPVACRDLALSASADFTTGPSGGTDCVNPWQDIFTVGFLAYEKSFMGDPTRARLLGGITVASSQTAEMSAGNEYYSIKFRIDSQKTVGTDACSGCLDPLCLVLNLVRITQASGPTIDVSNPHTSNYVTWQGGNVIGSLCTTPTLTPTWGRVKSLYR